MEHNKGSCCFITVEIIKKKHRCVPLVGFQIVKGYVIFVMESFEELVDLSFRVKLEIKCSDDDCKPGGGGRWASWICVVGVFLPDGGVWSCDARC